MQFTDLLADAGTPLMWFGCFQIFFGNLAIAWLEAAILRRLYGVDRIHDKLVLANFASMVGGLIAINLFNSYTGSWFSDDPFRSARLVIVASWIASFFLTVVIEGPFIAHALREPVRSPKVWRGSFIVNACSYAIIVPLACVVGPMSALKFHPAWTPAMSQLKGWIYYLDKTGQEVRRMRPDGAGDAPVLRLKVPMEDRFDYVLVESDEEQTEALLVMHKRGSPDKPKVLMHALGLARQAAQPKTRNQGYIIPGPYDALSFVPNHWAYAGEWAAEGLRVDDNGFALETPFAAYFWNSPTMLTKEIVLVQFGNGIYLVDVPSKAAFRVKIGKSPSFLRDP